MNADEYAAQEAPFTGQYIQATVEHLAMETRTAREDMNSIKDQRKVVREQIKEKKAEGQALETRRNVACIQERNKWCKRVVREHFAVGSKELDQQDATDNDEATSNLGNDFRDYDHIARSLPVFCVSSQEYQKLSGRFKDDSGRFQEKPRVPYFTTKDQTEVPQLRVHCKESNENVRAGLLRDWLNKYEMLLNSLTMWSSNTQVARELSQRERQKQAKLIHERLQILEQTLRDDIDKFIKNMLSNLQGSIYSHFETATRKARTLAIGTAAGWGSPRSQGGLHFNTYKATVRRNGFYPNGSHGPQDFNYDLTKPMLNQLIRAWEEVFHRQLPTMLGKIMDLAAPSLNRFHTSIQKHAEDQINAASALLRRQHKTYLRYLREITNNIQATITAQQRNANRVLKPEVQKHMSKAYATCSVQSGGGAFDRMKYAMQTHVTHERKIMFHEAAGTVRSHLDRLCQNACQQLTQEMLSIVNKIRGDYMAVLRDILKVPQPSPAEEATRKLKEKVARQLSRIREGD